MSTFRYTTKEYYGNNIADVVGCVSDDEEMQHWELVQLIYDKSFVNGSRWIAVFKQ